MSSTQIANLRFGQCFIPPPEGQLCISHRAQGHSGRGEGRRCGRWPTRPPCTAGRTPLGGQQRSPPIKSSNKKMTKNAKCKRWHLPQWRPMISPMQMWVLLCPPRYPSSPMSSPWWPINSIKPKSIQCERCQVCWSRLLCLHHGQSSQFSPRWT